MEINVSLTDISPSQKKLRVEVPESRVAKEWTKGTAIWRKSQGQRFPSGKGAS